mmetsp:Transcript_20221/g.42128  ORF Transcript_20221/g.42128 Transcript_20221/m.42128 type:complete len:221 (+) Transcript_20221:821-1483(+)
MACEEIPRDDGSQGMPADRYAAPEIRVQAAEAQPDLVDAPANVGEDFGSELRLLVHEDIEYNIVGNSADEGDRLDGSGVQRLLHVGTSVPAIIPNYRYHLHSLWRRRKVGDLMRPLRFLLGRLPLLLPVFDLALLNVGSQLRHLLDHRRHETDLRLGPHELPYAVDHKQDLLGGTGRGQEHLLGLPLHPVLPVSPLQLKVGAEYVLNADWFHLERVNFVA